MSRRRSINPFSRGGSAPADSPSQEPVSFDPVHFHLKDGHVTQVTDSDKISEIQRDIDQHVSDYLVTMYFSPTSTQIRELARDWGLHPVLVENLELPEQGKFETYGDVLYLPVRATNYRDSEEDIQVVPIQILLRGNEAALLFPTGQWVDGREMSLRSPTSPLHAIHNKHHPESIRRIIHAGPVGLVFWVVESVVDSYFPALEGLQRDLEQIEVEVFQGTGSASERVYRLNQEAIELQHAASALSRSLPPLEAALRTRYPHPDLGTYFNDLTHHLQRCTVEVTTLRDSLAQILTVNSTLVAQRQNDDMKKISGWAAVLFTPTLIAGIYGMNFINMPELDWFMGYPMAIGTMLVLAGILYFVFKRKDWL